MSDTNCYECGKAYAQDEMIKYDNSWVCASCKPVFLQRLKEGVQTGGTLQYAGFWIRFGAKFLDGIILQVVGLLVQGILGAVLISGAEPNLGAALIIIFAQLAVNFGYLIYFIGKFGATPGKMACGLKVVTPEGEPVSYGRAAGRAFAEILSSMTLLIGYIIAAFDDEKRSLHDRICNTRVIKK